MVVDNQYTENQEKVMVDQKEVVAVNLELTATASNGLFFVITLWER